MPLHLYIEINTAILLSRKVFISILNCRFELSWYIFWLGQGNISTYEWPIPTVLTDSRNKTRIETGGHCGLWTGPAPVCQQQARRQARIQTLLPTLPFYTSIIDLYIICTELYVYCQKHHLLYFPLPTSTHPHPDKNKKYFLTYLLDTLDLTADKEKMTL